MRRNSACKAIVTYRNNAVRLTFPKERSRAMDYASTLLQLLPSARRLPGLRELLNSIEAYLPAEQVERVRAAAEFGASRRTKGQKRLSGEPYIAHPLAAAQILADLHLDPDTIIAAILHDVIEDTPISKEELSEKFGAPSPRSSTASPSSTRSSSSHAPRRRPRASARWCSRWCATCA